MKRKHLLLDEQLLEDVTRISGETSPSKAVTRALEDFLRRHRARKILDLEGSGLWEGDLSEMRGDSARLMQQAVEERHRQQRRSVAIDELLEVRRAQRPLSDAEVAEARREGRP